MKLFTKSIDDQLFKQYPLGGDLENQKVVAKIFNPYGNGTWYIINSDPNDPNYLWAIVDLFEVEVGSVSRMDLETIKVPPFRLGLERDMSFTPINAEELYRGLLQGKRYEKGGKIDKYEIYHNTLSSTLEEVENWAKNNGYKFTSDSYFPDVTIGGIKYGETKRFSRPVIKDSKNKEGLLMIQIYRLDSGRYELNLYPSYEKGGSVADSNKQMLLNQAEGFEHHAKEFESAVEKADEIPAWVVAKAQRASTDLSDITHYLDGENEQKREMEEGEEYAKGGELSIKIGDKVKSKSGVSGIVYESTGTMFKLEDEYGNKSPKWHSTREFKKGDIKTMANGGMSDFGDFYGWSKKEVINNFGSDFDEGYPMVQYEKKGNKQEIESAIGVLKNGKKVYFDDDAVEWKEGDKMAKGGKLDVGVYRIGRPKKVSKNLYEQKIVEIFENGDISTASDYGRKLSDFKLQKYPIISQDKLDAQYKMAKGGYMAKGGEVKPYIIWVSKDGEKREFYGTYKSQRAAEMAMKKLWDNSDYKSMGNKPKDMYEKEGFYEYGGYMASGGKIKDQYDGREPEDIWNNLSKSQRQHFIYDHASDIQEYRGEEYGELSSFEIIKAYNSDYSQLDKNIKNRFNNHVREGQYKYGGYMAKGGSVDPMATINEIARLSGLRPIAVAEWGDKNNINLVIVLKDLKSKKIKGVDLMTAIVGNPNNKYSKELLAKYSRMAMGGVTFDDKVKAVKSSLLKRKKVSPSVQKDYGKTYSKKEAEESAKRIVGAQTARERLKMRMAKKKKK